MTPAVPQPPAPGVTDDPLIILAPLGRDAAIACRTLGRGGIDCTAAADLADLVAAVRDGKLSAVLLTEEALVPAGVAELATALAAQPSWSDLPVLLLLAEGGHRPGGTGRAVATLRAAGNVIVLVRPIPAVALVTAAQAARRARQRQYEVRDLIGREQAARRTAEEADRLKDEFLATVSHELRTPLSAMLIWSQLLSSGKVAAADTPRALLSIEHNAEMQSRLIEDLLDVSRMTSGQLRLNPVDTDLAIVAQEAAATVRPAATAKNISVVTALDATTGPAHVDPDRIHQVICNLLNNAIKFTPAGGRVTLGLACGGGGGGDRDGDGDGQTAVLRVTDTGQGIAPAFLPHVFERFRQADARSTRRHGGLGLGLAITHRLVEMHGGTIGVESDGPGHGAVFTVRLPLAPVVDAPRQRLAGVRVLLVEDEVATRSGLTQVFRHAGATVTAADSAAAALAAFAEAVHAGVRPDVLVSDIAMPDEDGYTLLRGVREEERRTGGPPLSALAISAYANAQERRHALDAGFVDLIGKPLDTDGLINTIAALVTGPAESEPTRSTD